MARPAWQRKADQSGRYGPEHRRLRRQWEPQVATGTVRCWRCGRLIPGDAAWQLGHDDDDPNVWRGPECVPCNQGAAARRGGLNRPRIRRPAEPHPGLL